MSRRKKTETSANLMSAIDNFPLIPSLQPGQRYQETGQQLIVNEFAKLYFFQYLDTAMRDDIANAIISNYSNVAWTLMRLNRQ